MPPANGEVLLENHPGTPFPGRSHGNCRKTKPASPLSPGTTQGSSTAALGTAPAPGEAGNKCPPVIALPAATGAAPGAQGHREARTGAAPAPPWQQRVRPRAAALGAANTPAEQAGTAGRLQELQAVQGKVDAAPREALSSSNPF